MGPDLSEATAQVTFYVQRLLDDWSENATWREIAARLGVSHAALVNIHQGRSMVDQKVERVFANKLFAGSVDALGAAAMKAWEEREIIEHRDVQVPPLPVVPSLAGTHAAVVRELRESACVGGRSKAERSKYLAAANALVELDEIRALLEDSTLPGTSDEDDDGLPTRVGNVLDELSEAQRQLGRILNLVNQSTLPPAARVGNVLDELARLEAENVEPWEDVKSRLLLDDEGVTVQAPKGSTITIEVRR